MKIRALQLAAKELCGNGFAVQVSKSARGADVLVTDHTTKQASRFTIDDESDPVSELQALASDAIAALKRKR